MQRHDLPVTQRGDLTDEQRDVDWWQYKERSRVECFFQKIKNYRRIATRHDTINWQFDFPALYIWCVFWSG